MRHTLSGEHAKECRILHSFGSLVSGSTSRVPKGEPSCSGACRPLLIAPCFPWCALDATYRPWHQTGDYVRVELPHGFHEKLSPAAGLRVSEYCFHGR